MLCNYFFYYTFLSIPTHSLPNSIIIYFSEKMIWGPTNTYILTHKHNWKKKYPGNYVCVFYYIL